MKDLPNLLLLMIERSSQSSSSTSSTFRKEASEPSQNDNTATTTTNPFAFTTYFPHMKRDPVPDFGLSATSSLSYPTFLTPSFATEHKDEAKTASYNRAPSINQQFEDVLSNLDQIKRSISVLETCIQQLNNSSNTLGTRLEQLDQKTNNLGTCLEQLDRKHNTLGTSLEHVDQKCNTLGTCIEQLDRKCNALGTCMEQLNHRSNPSCACRQPVDHKNKPIDEKFMQELHNTGSIIAQETVRVVDKAMTDWIQKIYNRIDIRVSQYEVLTRCMMQRRQPPCPRCSKVPNEYDRLPYSCWLITRGSLIQPNTEL